MDAKAAVDIASRITYKPDWTLEFNVADARHIRMRTEFVMPDSSVEYAADGYPRMSRPGRTVTLQVDDLDTPADLRERIFAVILQRELHECLEFYRTDLGGPAPYHPHRDDTMAAWTARGPAIMADTLERIEEENAEWRARTDPLAGLLSMLRERIGRDAFV